MFIFRECSQNRLKPKVSEAEIDSGENIEGTDEVFAGVGRQPAEDRVGVGTLVQKITGGQAELDPSLETVGDGSVDKDGVLGVVFRKHGVVMLTGHRDVQALDRGQPQFQGMVEPVLPFGGRSTGKREDIAGIGQCVIHP